MGATISEKTESYFKYSAKTYHYCFYPLLRSQPPRRVQGQEMIAARPHNLHWELMSWAQHHVFASNPETNLK